METFVNKYLWVVMVALLALSSGLLAAGANRTLASVALIPEPLPLQIQRKEKREESAEDRSTAVLNRSLFDSSRLAQVDEGGDDEGGENPETDPALEGELGELGEHVPLSDLNVTVNGTVVSTIASSSNASIQDGPEARLYFEGDEVKDGAVVYAIRREAVYVRRSGRLERLALGGEAKGGAPRPGVSRTPLSASTATTSTSPAGGAVAAVRDGIKKTGAWDYEVDRGMLDEQLQDLNKLGSQARIIPHYKDGRADGFKLVGIRPGSLYTYLGVRSGDVIRRVNGEDMNSPTKALALYERLRSASQVSVDIERRGQPQTLSFTIK